MKHAPGAGSLTMYTKAGCRCAECRTLGNAQRRAHRWRNIEYYRAYDRRRKRRQREANRATLP